jgi:hypothetical protein
VKRDQPDLRALALFMVALSRVGLREKFVQTRNLLFCDWLTGVAKYVVGAGFSAIQAVFAIGQRVISDLGKVDQAGPNLSFFLHEAKPLKHARESGEARIVGHIDEAQY